MFKGLKHQERHPFVQNQNISSSQAIIFCRFHIKTHRKLKRISAYCELQNKDQDCNNLKASISEYAHLSQCSILQKIGNNQLNFFLKYWYPISLSFHVCLNTCMPNWQVIFRMFLLCYWIDNFTRRKAFICFCCFYTWKVWRLFLKQYQTQN